MIVAMIHILLTQSHDIWTALVQHSLLSILAILLAGLIAIPLAILLTRHQKTGEFFLQLFGMIQTIPSLAILGALIPLVGIGLVPAVIALVLYAIMPIFQNTYAGLIGIDPNLMEAAEAFALPKRYTLLKVQLPLAMPMILSGVRIATVMVIGTATLAALIGGGGLGTFIMLGIQTNNNAELLIGALLSAGLALLFVGGIKLLSHLSWKSISVILVILTTLGVTSYGIKQSFQRKDTIVIAGKLGGEPDILINMYKFLIEKDMPNVQVELKPNFGGTSFLYQAIKSDQIDIYPEFTGTVLQSLTKKAVTVDRNSQHTYQLARKLLKQQDNLVYLKPMRYQNGYALAVRQSDAKKYHLKSLSDLTKISMTLRGGFDPDFYKQADGYPGLKKVYGLSMQSTKTMESSLRYEALNHGQIDVTDAYTTDPQLKQYHLVTLTDDKHFFPPYQGAPLIRAETLKKYPKIKMSLNRLANKISTQDMIDMNYQVTVQHHKAEKVARHFLQQKGILK